MNRKHLLVFGALLTVGACDEYYPQPQPGYGQASGGAAVQQPQPQYAQPTQQQVDPAAIQQQQPSPAMDPNAQAQVDPNAPPQQAIDPNAQQPQPMMDPNAMAAGYDLSQAPPQRVDEAVIQSTLDSYGSWVNDPTYGTIWYPSQDVVGAEFTPYGTSGHWVNTDAGWFWQSDYSWGWLPFHYGRWVTLNNLWAWVPGRLFAPAWVDWRMNDSYIGWAPLPPEGAYYGGSYYFSSYDTFTSLNLWPGLLWGPRAAAIYPVTRAIPVSAGIGGAVYARGPGVSVSAPFAHVPPLPLATAWRGGLLSAHAQTWIAPHSLAPARPFVTSQMVAGGYRPGGVGGGVPLAPSIGRPGVAAPSVAGVPAAYRAPVPTIAPTAPMQGMAPQAPIYRQPTQNYAPQGPVYRPPVQNYAPQAPVYRPPVQNYAPQAPVYRPPVQTYAPQAPVYRPPVQTYAPPQQMYRPAAPAYRPPVQYSPPSFRRR